MTSQEQVQDRTIRDYLDQLASSAPTPGGGSVAGVIAALAISLGRMVVSLSESTLALAEAEARLKEGSAQAISFSDADERAYGGYIAATRMPKVTPEEKIVRRQAMQRALLNSAETPMRLAELIASIKPTLAQVAELGNPHVVSDAAIALILADAAIEACLINVRVNLPMIKDADAVAEFESRIAALPGNIHG
jgi:formiminotetrahydrofolate cyclodeaminase